MFNNEQIARLIEAQILRFPRGYRRRLRKFSADSPRLGDLLVSFPAIAFALASGSCNPERRGKAVALVKAGAPLAEVAAVLGVPMWTRKLPPETFTEPFGKLPGEDGFSRRIVPLIPANNAASAAWFRWMLAGYRACDARFALWLAGRDFYSHVDVPGGNPVAPLAAYAWYSARPSGEAGRALIARPFQPSMGYRKAVVEAGAWVSRVSNAVALSPRRRGPGRYSRRNAMNGLHFVLLRTSAQLHDEGRIMDHCVGSYVHKVAGGGCIIVSIRRGGQRLATMELVARSNDRLGRYAIAQLQGPSNERPPSAVSRLASDWLNKNGHSPLSGDGLVQETAVDGRAWERLWAPYVACKGDAAAFARNDLSLSRLMGDVEQLGRYA